jgi:hypothetical protein
MAEATDLATNSIRACYGKLTKAQLFASRPSIMGQVLSIAYRCIATRLVKEAGFSGKTVRTGAVTSIQRFRSALNSNTH